MSPSLRGRRPRAPARRLASWTSVLLLLLVAGIGPAMAQPASLAGDPYASPVWEDLRRSLLPGPMVWDSGIRVTAPADAEDARQLPITIDATGLGQPIRRILVAVDFGPFPHVLSFEPIGVEPRLFTRIKIDQATPIRAAALTQDGVWHVGSTYTDALGGGCSAPPAAYADADWAASLGRIQGRALPQGRIRFVIDHPMDTGLSSNIPTFIIQDLSLESEGGRPLARLTLHEPIAEDPTFGFDLLPGSHAGEGVRLEARDNNGNEFQGLLPAELTQ